MKRIKGYQRYGDRDDTWRVFHIMSEFVEGYETLSKIGKAVSVFGSARVGKRSKYYRTGERIGYLLAKAGYAVITGAGPGLMESANRGAKRAGGESIGLNIVIPTEQKPNPHLTTLLNFRYFFCRKVMFLRYAKGFIFLPGGYGTMDELFEALNLIQTKREKPFPVVLIGKKYWKGLIDWLKKESVAGGYITQNDLKIINVTDSAFEAVSLIRKFVAEK